jgi:hypothetical protein
MSGTIHASPFVEGDSRITYIMQVLRGFKRLLSDNRPGSGLSLGQTGENLELGANRLREIMFITDSSLLRPSSCTISRFDKNIIINSVSAQDLA